MGVCVSEIPSEEIRRQIYMSNDSGRDEKLDLLMRKIKQESLESVICIYISARNIFSIFSNASLIIFVKTVQKVNSNSTQKVLRVYQKNEHIYSGIISILGCTAAFFAARHVSFAFFS